MRFFLELSLVVLATLAAFRLVGGAAARRKELGVKSLLVATGLRMASAVVIAAVVGLGSSAHKAALISAVGATYFAVAVYTGYRAWCRTEAKA